MFIKRTTFSTQCLAFLKDFWLQQRSGEISYSAVCGGGSGSAVAAQRVPPPPHGTLGVPLSLREGEVTERREVFAVSGGIQITTSPSGLEVSVDGRTQGRTPLTVSDLPPGSHEVTVSDPCMTATARTMVVASGETGVLHLIGRPRDALLFVVAVDPQGEPVAARVGRRASSPSREPLYIGNANQDVTLSACTPEVIVSGPGGVERVVRLASLPGGERTTVRTVFRRRPTPTAPSARSGGTERDRPSSRTNRRKRVRATPEVRRARAVRARQVTGLVIAVSGIGVIAAAVPFLL